MLSDILSTILVNWEMVEANNEIMSTLDMNQNSLCADMKRLYPNMMNKFIQAYVFSLWLYILFTLGYSYYYDVPQETYQDDNRENEFNENLPND